MRYRCGAAVKRAQWHYGDMPVAVATLGLIVGAAGCTLTSNARVGEWRAQTIVRQKVCVENTDPTCSKPYQITTREPARRFSAQKYIWGFVGGAATQRRDETVAVATFEGGLEYLRGKGATAFGLRQTASIDFGGNGGATMFPLTGVAYHGLTDLISIHGGVGYSWYSRIQDSDSYSVVRALAGVDLTFQYTTGGASIGLVIDLLGKTQLSDPGNYSSLGITSSMVLNF